MISEINLSKQVCVIGAGPSGLVAARELRKEGHSVVVLEQNHDVGGQWLYDPIREGVDSGKGATPEVHSSVYASLRLAFPREITGFTDFPFLVKEGRDMRRFPGHKELLLYLKDFCECFGLKEMVRFNTRVELVGMVDSAKLGKDMKWVVRSKDKMTENLMEEVFDVVVVATGQYSHPRLPSIKGMDTWRRKQIHSHIYRVPEPFCNEVVVVIGNSLSGQDISMELVDVAKEIHLSAKSLDISEGLSKVISKHENLHIQPQIDSLHGDGQVLFIDGSRVFADTIIYCTGYSYSFPFLDTKGIVAVDDDRVGPLYEHTFPPSLAPSLSFMGIPRRIIAFPFFETQAKWIAQLLSGKRTLPSCEDMMQSVKEFYHSRDVAGIPKHRTHVIENFEDAFIPGMLSGQSLVVGKSSGEPSQTTMVSEINLSKHVCVIGAGPSGVVAARELRKEGHSVVVLEQKHDVGGQWLYEPIGESHDSGKGATPEVHGSVYASLRLNTPREITAFTDFPFLVKKDRDMRRFPGHRELLLYLEDFCEWFGLKEMIRFNTRVEYVGMVDVAKFGEDMKWVVRSKNKMTRNFMEEVFDAVVVATGHYSKPRLPSIKGFLKMNGYMEKEAYAVTFIGYPSHSVMRCNGDKLLLLFLQVVVVIGNSISGRDISMELVDIAKEIHLSAKSLEISEGLSKVISKHENLHIHPRVLTPYPYLSYIHLYVHTLIDSLHEDGRVLFIDGSWLFVDTIVYCTGYSYSFPFLETKGIVVVDDDRVGPLYEHTFPPSLAPSLSFVGIPAKILPFLFFESQAKWIAQLMSGKRILPSCEDMMQSIKEFYHSRDVAGIPKHKTHEIPNFEYWDMYGDHSGSPHLEEWIKEICISTLRNANTNLETYRDSCDDLKL
ncbi:hypothetical protein HHK36_024275 [Tetracentron sinense]|uniref:Flavin-containing monooxygenase n=1 Tax=Tetracentron sinense TaxID=13715 RepID=A0A834YMI3_TETSI|nr:hypothetical protein HHK36_024275 [Tetracentron sinense]